jgi:hypothetical protein
MPAAPNVFSMRIVLLEHEPEIWRRVIVPGSVRLDKLHLILQDVMGWTNSHLHQFRMSNALYGMHVEDWSVDEVEYTLSEVVRPGGRFLYDYDFGDSWEHEVIVEYASTIRPVLKFAVCTDGARACPPEDVGGPVGMPICWRHCATPVTRSTRSIAPGLERTSIRHALTSLR